MKLTVKQLKQLIKEQVEEAKLQKYARAAVVDAYNLKPMLETMIGATYPLETLKKRLALLSPEQQNKIAKLHERMEANAETIDNILSSVGNEWP